MKINRWMLPPGLLVDLVGDAGKDVAAAATSTAVAISCEVFAKNRRRMAALEV